MVNFFIDRPIFAWVIAIVIMLSGAASITALPVSEYPTIAPPTIQIAANYPGASAETVENTVTQVIEQQMSGLDHLLYLSSTSDNTGQSTITLTFEAGTDPDIAQVQVQNKLQLATPLLPVEVQQQGAKVTKSTYNFMMVMAFVSTDGSMKRIDLTNYVASHVEDPISRLDGVGTVTLFGTQYAMRIWLNPDKLLEYGLTPNDVTNALTAQNVEISGGQFGGPPAVSGQQLTAAITEASLLTTPSQFRNVVLRVNRDGSQVRVGDVARVALGSENYNYDTRYNGEPSAGLGIGLAPGANALQTADEIRAKMAQLSPYFPRGMVAEYPYDTTPFVRLSIKDVVVTLFMGIGLVFLVMYLFLQNIRATIIPTIAIPVVLLGTFGVMLVAGFSINTLSMFGMVLAIGLLVDDAIVVVENVERVIEEEGLSPREATRKAMSQLTGALLGVALVLSAVFVPMALSGGSVGAIYRQFSLTIVAAMALSVMVALILTPALCATILKPRHVTGPRKGFFGWFNRNFDHGRDLYHSGVGHVIGRSGLWFIVYGAVVIVAILLFVRLPTSFLPNEDQGFLLVTVQTPPGSTLEETQKILTQVAERMRYQERQSIDATFEVDGFSFAGRSQNAGVVFALLKDWSKRTSPDLQMQPLMNRLSTYYDTIKGAKIIVINPPPIPELGIASGFDLELEDRAGMGHNALVKARDQLIAMGHHDPRLKSIYANGLDDTPSFTIGVDHEKASAYGLTLADIDQNFTTAWASSYVNNFLDTDGRVKKVYVQGDNPYRMNPGDLGRWYIRNGNGDMLPFTSVASGKWTYGSPKLERYNGISAFEIQGLPAIGKSTGDAITAVEELVKKLPPGFGYEWTGITYQQLLSGSQAPVLYGVSLLVVFLSLAALYESWAIPFAVILVIPLGIIGALLATTFRGLSDDVYFQVGLLTTMGLSAKNAILIVEFARDLEAEGRSPVEAAMEAARLRIRPIIMTSLAFILGVLPLSISSGAGSASQHAIGTGVIGGMFTATFFAVFMIPMFFVVISKKFARKSPRADVAKVET